MCEQGRVMRLCACDGDTLDEKNMWILYSKRHVIGRFLVANDRLRTLQALFYILVFPLWLFAIMILWLLGKLNSSKLLGVFSNSYLILYQLNSFDVFDFEYVPTQGDVLVVYLNGKKHSFRFERGGWVVSSKVLIGDRSIEKEFMRGRFNNL
jgi:hypothetical protein